MSILSFVQRHWQSQWHQRARMVELIVVRRPHRGQLQLMHRNEIVVVVQYEGQVFAGALIGVG
jgi:hypothetical protein